jgi:hypothetical protein
MEILFIVAAVAILGFFVYIILQGKGPKGEKEIIKAEPVAVVPQKPEPEVEEEINTPSHEEDLGDIEDFKKDLDDREEEEEEEIGETI